MKVLLIRHAIAEDYTLFSLSGQADDLRPLTTKGKTKMKKGIRGLQKLVSQVHHIVSSPLRRAIQTADLVAQSYPDAHREILSALAPRGSTTTILEHLQGYSNTSHVIVLIGHEPHLGELATWLLSGHIDTWLPLKKGSACLLEFSGEVAAGQADLCWVLTPKQLRMLS